LFYFLSLCIVVFSQTCNTSPDGDFVPPSPPIPKHVQPTLIKDKDELASIRTMGEYQAPNNKLTNCPHLVNGLLHWHNPDTWGGKIPRPGGDVTIPAGKSVLISCPPPQGYDTIIIPEGSRLIFNDVDQVLKIRDIKVEGRLVMGSDTCRLTSNIKIQFTGVKQSTDYDNGIVATGKGQIDLHGKQFHPTWTRLAASVKSGSTIIYLQDTVNWEVGQEIVVLLVNQ